MTLRCNPNELCFVTGADRRTDEVQLIGLPCKTDRLYYFQGMACWILETPFVVRVTKRSYCPDTGTEFWPGDMARVRAIPDAYLTPMRGIGPDDEELDESELDSERSFEVTT